MPWSGGVYTRGYPSWSNDAASNLPISSTKFDTEDNDFAAGLNNCLTKDGLTSPSTTLNWSQTAAVVIALLRGSDGTIFSAGRSGGSNNPVLQIINADATGITLNLSTTQQFALSINGANAITIASTRLVSLAAGLSVSAAAAGATVALATAAGGQFLSASDGTITATGTFAASTFNWGTGNANPLSLVTNGNGRLSINSNGGVSINSPSTSQVALTITQNNAVQGLVINGSCAEGLRVAGTAANGSFLQVYNNATFVGFFGAALQQLAGTNAGDLAIACNSGVNLYLGVNATPVLQLSQSSEVGIVTPSTIGNLASGMTQVGYMDMPLHDSGAALTLALTDRGKFIRQNSTGGVTIPANASVAFPVGTTIMVYNNTGSSQTISITTDTLTWLPSGSTGTRTLANLGVATLYKLSSTGWLLWGFGIS